MTDNEDDDDDDDLRCTSVLMLGEAMRDETPLLDVATAVESAVHASFASSSSSSSSSSLLAYKQKVRFLAANIKRNARLRESLRLGVLKPSEVVEMTDEELMTDAMRRKIESIKVKMDKQSERAVFADGIESNSYVCKECKGTKTKFIHLSDTRDVRKAETWGNSDEESKVLVVCSACKNEWVCSIL
jgi:hypothetical protein